MIAVPKNILIKLVENQIESELQQQKPPTKCQCHCQCGRYPNDMLIVDKVMTDILESSSKEFGNFENNTFNNNNGSTPSSSVSSHTSRRDSTSFFPQQQPQSCLSILQTSTKMDTAMDTSNSTPSNSENTPINFFANGSAPSALTSNSLPGIQSDFLTRSSTNSTSLEFNTCK